MESLAPEDPRTIGGYRLLARLGEGGMGQVYLARSERGRTVAVKTIQPGLAREPDFRRRFAREITTARRVGGEWTAPVLDADTEAATPWVATGYIAGPTLHRVVAEDYGPLPERSLAFLASGLTRALRDIHSTGLIHRDLKPSNIMITIDGPRVIDFGIARALDGITSGGLTRTGAVIGSPGFMSPEQVRGQRLTPASDVFCLGSVLAYAATGRLPFGTGDSGGHALMFRIVEEEPDLDGVPDAVRGLVADCLLKDAEQRPGVEGLLERTGPGGDGPWLPAEVLAQLGRHAVSLLDSEDPDAVSGPAAPPAPPAPGGPRTPPTFGAHADVTTAAPSPGGAAHPPTYAVPPAHTPPPHHTPVPPHTLAPPHTPVPGAPVPRAPVTYTPQGYREPPTRPWHSAPAYAPPPPAPPPKPRPVRGSTTALTALFAVMALTLAVTLALYAQVAGDIGDWESELLRGGGDVTLISETAEKRKNDLEWFANAAGVVQLALFLVWLIWFWQVRRNAEAFAPGRIRYKQSRAAVFWFIPLANLALPKQIADDIWRASHPRPYASLALVNAWWTLLLAYLLSGVVLSGQPWHEAENVGQATRRAVLGALQNGLGLAAAVAALVLVRRIAGMQHARLTGTPH
ncbi:protein kinase domain-containing protein [Streptomyces sp. SBT349]|uniref:protein kinase domain-containing protein n=1 Tax=Streptomyces sp. SBT349 TaxID=1580539 RepID=UPI00069CCCC3|nr:DUF4328 domain-containing protein [Streptomyces sp. SBT349]